MIWLRQRGPQLRTAGAALLLGLLPVLGLVLVLWKVPEWQLPQAPLEPRERIEILNDTRRTLSQIVALAILLTGLCLSVWSAVTIARGALQAREQQGRIARFTAAVEQLGSETLTVRLGGIYALQRLAALSAENRPAIKAVLTAYVREQAPWHDDGQQPAPQPAVEIQTILTVLGGRDWVKGDGEGPEDGLNLAGTDLRGVALDGARLAGADLTGSHLERALLAGAQLVGANLHQAHLDGADLSAADLTEANLRAIDLERALLVGACLRGGNFRDAVLDGANLSAADLTDAIGLTYQQLTRAITDTRTVLPDTP